MTNVYTLDKLDSIEAEAIRGSTAQKGIYVTPNLIRRFKGDGNTAIIFKRFLYCCEQWADEEGWFYQTADTVEQVVGLGYTALQRSVKRLERMGLIEKKLGGMPYKTHYRVNLSAYLELIKQSSSSGTSTKTSLDTSAKTSPNASDETCSDTSGQQVILSDLSSDKESDTYAADADFSPSPKTPNEPRKEQADGDQLGSEDAPVPNGPDEENLRARDQKSAGEAVLRGEVPGQTGLPLPDGGRDHAPAGEKPDALTLDLARATAEARAEAGNSATPPSAGGSFALGDRLITVACARLGRSEPQGDKRKSARAFFEKALKAEGLLQGDVAMLEEAVKCWLDPEGDYTFYLSQYALTPKHELALRHFGIVLSKAKAQAEAQPARRARDVEATEASLIALQERQAARSPPVEGDWAWEAAKRELQLQADKHTFETWVANTVGLGREDGVYIVAVADAEARDYLTSRLKTTAERTLVGILGESVEVRFEVEP